MLGLVGSHSRPLSEPRVLGFWSALGFVKVHSCAFTALWEVVLGCWGKLGRLVKHWFQFLLVTPQSFFECFTFKFFCFSRIKNWLESDALVVLGVNELIYFYLNWRHSISLLIEEGLAHFCTSKLLCYLMFRRFCQFIDSLLSFSHWLDFTMRSWKSKSVSNLVLDGGHHFINVFRHNLIVSWLEF